MRFRVDQSVVGARDLCRVILTCDGDIMHKAAGKNSSDVHRVINDGAAGSDESSASSLAGREVAVTADWVWRCVMGGKVLAV